MVNINEFKAAMVRKGLTAGELAELIGISRQSLSYRINNAIDFRISEVERISQILGLSLEEKNLIFFGNQVDRSPTATD